MIVIDLPDRNGRRWILRLTFWPGAEFLGQWDTRLKVFIPLPGVKLTHRDIAGIDRRLDKIYER
jgi:hypothetical protein